MAPPDEPREQPGAEIPRRIESGLRQRGDDRDDDGDRQADEQRREAVSGAAGIAPVRDRKHEEREEGRADALGQHGLPQRDALGSPSLRPGDGGIGEVLAQYHAGQFAARLPPDDPHGRLEGVHDVAEEDVQSGRRAECTRELGRDVERHFPHREPTIGCEGQGHGRIDVRARDRPGGVDCQGDCDAPHHGHLPQSGLRPGEHGRVDGAHPEEYEHIRAEKLGNALMAHDGRFHDTTSSIGPAPHLKTFHLQGKNYPRSLLLPDCLRKNSPLRIRSHGTAEYGPLRGRQGLTSRDIIKTGLLLVRKRYSP